MITRVKGFLKRHKSLLHQWNLAQTTLNICICKINNRWGQNIIKQMQITIINDNNENVSLHTTTDSELLAAETSSSEQNVKKGHSSWLVPNLVKQRAGFIDQCHYVVIIINMTQCRIKLNRSLHLRIISMEKSITLYLLILFLEYCLVRPRQRLEASQRSLLTLTSFF